MRRVFVSSYSCGVGKAAEIIAALRAAGVEVNHSPRDTADSSWGSWYSEGLAKSLSQCQAFVAVIDGARDSSTWMAIECDTARKILGNACFCWNPDHIKVTEGMLGYLGRRLSDRLSDATSQVR